MPGIDLSRWSLQLPVDADGGEGQPAGDGEAARPAASVPAARLAAGYADPWFHADAEGRVVFTAPANGAVTTPGVGSDHTRSELREVYAGPGATAHGDWTSALGGELRASCAVWAVAMRSDVATLAQIHGQERVFVLLVYRPARRDVAVDLYARNADGSGHQRTPIAAGVAPGDPITFTLRYAGDTLTVTVNGDTRQLPVDRSWAGAPVYFKLGAYHAAPNTGNAEGDLTRVACSAFAVEHGPAR